MKESPPSWSGSTGHGPFGNILDVYDVRCNSGTPAAIEIYMDMYHGGFMESRPVPGFTRADQSTREL